MAELLDGLYATRVWHEPYFGTLLAQLGALPSEYDRKDFVFSGAYADVWHKSLRALLLTNVRARFGRISHGTQIVIKDINAPQLCPYFASILPESHYLLLIRDPYDVLDSHIDMTRPGSWAEDESPTARVEALADRIHRTLATAVDGYDRVQADHRMQIRYCDLLGNPKAELQRCVEFMKLPVSEDEIDATINANQFGKHQESGRLSFRRFGVAGIWHESGNFTPDVLAIARERLGPLRKSLGY